MFKRVLLLLLPSALIACTLRPDRAANSYTKEFLFAQSNNDRQLLGMVEMALSRIREGSFGECIHCGNEINAKRLEAVPWTRYCIECQEKMEKGLLEESHT